MGWIGGKQKKMDTFRVCITHWLIIDTLYCPRDACRSRQSPILDNCVLAGEFATRQKAERWMLRYEVNQIEAQIKEEQDKP